MTQVLGIPGRVPPTPLAPTLLPGLILPPYPCPTEASAPHLTHSPPTLVKGSRPWLAVFLHPSPIFINSFNLRGHLGQHPQLNDNNLLNSVTVVGRILRCPKIPGRWYAHTFSQLFSQTTV